MDSRDEEGTGSDTEENGGGRNEGSKCLELVVEVTGSGLILVSSDEEGTGINTGGFCGGRSEGSTDLAMVEELTSLGFELEWRRGRWW